MLRRIDSGVLGIVEPMCRRRQSGRVVRLEWADQRHGVPGCVLGPVLLTWAYDGFRPMDGNNTCVDEHFLVVSTQLTNYQSASG